MKTIKKIKDNIGKVAGSALLVGATLTAGAAAVSAQDSGSSGDLGDYPAPFVNDDGEVDTTVVVGETAEDGNPVSTADVVSAVEIAGSLGNAAFETTEESVEVSSGVASWNADGGITLNRQNSDLFLDDASDAEENRLDDSDLNVLETTTFQSEDNEEVEIDQEVNVGEQDQNFNSAVGDVDDPVLHLTVPSGNDVVADGDADEYLFTATAEFDSTIDFSETDSSSDSIDAGADEVLEDGDTIEMFGAEFTFSDESDETELVLYGSSDRFEISTGESDTVTVDGEDHEFQVEYVSEASSGTQDATVIVDGSTQSVEESDTINIGDTEVRVSDIYRTGPDGQGRVAFSQGSDEVVISENGDVEVDGDTVDGVDVSFESSESGGTDGAFDALDSMTFAFGAEDSDEDYLAAGETYVDPVFGSLEFHYGGLSADAQENPAETMSLDVQEDSEATFTVTNADGEEADLVFTQDDNSFGPDTDATYAQYEGQAITEDDRVVLNSNEQAGLYEVTNVDDTDLDDGDSDGTVGVTLENVFSGDTVEVEEDNLELDGGDLNADGSYTVEGESIGGMNFDVTFHGSDDEVSFERAGDEPVAVLPHLYTETDAAVSLYDYGTDNEVVDLTNLVDREDFTGSDEGSSHSTGTEVYASISSGAASDDADTADITLYDGSDNVLGSGTINGDTTNSGYTEVTDSDGNSIDASSTSVEKVEVTAADGQVTGVELGTDADGSSSTDFTGLDTLATKTVEVPSGVASNDATFEVDFDATDSVSNDHIATDLPDFVKVSYNVDGNHLEVGSAPTNDPAVMVTQPEDDEDNEHAYMFDVDSSDSAGDINVAYTGGRQDSASGHEGDVSVGDWLTADMDSEDNVEVGYNFYGAYTSYDTDDSDQETFSLSLPGAQSTSGLAMTGTDGSLSAEGGTSGGTVESSSPTYERADAALDSEMEGSARTDSNLILVGGPSVNSLVGELVDDNQTMPAEDYTEGEGMIQMVNGFSDEGHSALIVAGHSGEDTRAAGEFLADYRNNQEALEGQSQVTVSTETGQVVE